MTPALSFLVVYNQGTGDNTAGQTDSDLNAAKYAAIYTIWHLTDALLVGAEFLRGTREDLDNTSGTANRLQFSVKYVFN